jgi:hypothetical protein
MPSASSPCHRVDLGYGARVRLRSAGRLQTFTCSNFSFGGARSLQPSGECRTGYTDNLPTVTGKKVDAKGCTYWEPDPSGARTCGGARPVDGGADAGHDASLEDAHHDDGGGDGGDDAADASDGAIDH